MKILVLHSFFGKDFRPTATTLIKKRKSMAGVFP